MAPTLVREPVHRDGWVYEEKVDGWRIPAYKGGEHIPLGEPLELIASWWRSRQQLGPKAK